MLCKLKALKLLKRRNVIFDFIYADPPYEKEYYTRIVNLVKNLNLLDKDGILMLEEPKRKPFIPENSRWIVERRSYGTTVVTFINFSEEEDV